MTAIAEPPSRPSAAEGSAPGQKCLKANELSYLSNVVIARRRAPRAYSLAATLGFIVAVPGVGLMLWAGAAHREFFRMRPQVLPTRVRGDG
jgi:hypothetical protein